MFMTLARVLDEPDIAVVVEKANSLRWHDGKKTAGRTAALVKHNLQADLSDKPGAALHKFLLRAVSEHMVLKSAARPAQFSNLILSRTEDGGNYGLHVDNATMGPVETRIRTDLSFTLFLSDPEDYDGGELLLETSSGEYRAKPPAGDLVLYPSGALHRVTPVTRGTRLACVGWIQSEVRRADQREILFDLENLRAISPQGDTRLVLDKSISNLIRMWRD